MLVGAGDKLVPGLLGVGPQNVIIVRVEGYIVLVYVGKELICSKNLGDLNQLVVVVLALKERLLLEDHASEHAT